MKNIKKLFLFFLINILLSYLKASILDNKNTNQLNDISSTLKGTWDGASMFIKGIKMSFGWIPNEDKYSFEVWNDSTEEIFVAVQHVTGLMGANFKGNIIRSQYIYPFVSDSSNLPSGAANGTSGNFFYDIHLYCVVYLCANKDINHKVISYNDLNAVFTEGAKISKTLTNVVESVLAGQLIANKLTDPKIALIYRAFADPTKLIGHDKNIYYWRAYTAHDGYGNLEIKGEYLLEPCTSTESFSGNFFNNTQGNIFLTFAKGEKEFTVTLEPNTFSMLSSDTSGNNRIRQEGRSFKFTGANFANGKNEYRYPIPPRGIASLIEAQKKGEKNKKSVTIPKTYTFELFGKPGSIHLGLQALSIGCYDQYLKGEALDKDGKPLAGNKNGVFNSAKIANQRELRDINPVKCFIWHKSAKEAQEEESKKEKSDSSSVYFDSYHSVWYAYKTDDWTLMEKIDPGTCLETYLIRPKISEQKAYLFVVSLDTNDEKKAKEFLNDLCDGKIGEKSIYTNVKIKADKEKFGDILLSGKLLPNNNGIIKNKGTTGYILLADVFYPTGLGEGPCFYTIPPSTLYINQLRDAFINYIDTKKKQNATNFLNNDKLISWIVEYPKKSKKVENEIIMFLKKYGDKSLYDKEGLTLKGTNALQFLIHGAIGIINFPGQKNAGVNNYITNWWASQKPKNWSKNIIRSKYIKKVSS